MARYIVVALAIVGTTLSAVAIDRRGASASRAATPPTPTPMALHFEYDCTKAPWDCDGGPTVRKFQVWSQVCDEGRCQWRWLSRANPGLSTHLEIGGSYRLFYTGDDRPDTIADYPVAATPAAGQIYLDVIYRCNRYRFLCDEDTWQLYACWRQTDGSCEWMWRAPLAPAPDAAYTVLGPGDYLLAWGTPQWPDPSTATGTSTAGTTPTGTNTVTPTITATVTASATTSTSTRSPTASSGTRTATRVSATATASPTPPRTALYLPIASNG